ncbi:transcription termination factor 1-like isoform X2 [Euwallacea fornicatus]|uniref:transcription termination factor 1-like isoform X2 n=1 Tax=Euwallacea fornicatus TaxID=995702 RepID=UPI00338DF51D
MKPFSEDTSVSTNGGNIEKFDMQAQDLDYSRSPSMHSKKKKQSIKTITIKDEDSESYCLFTRPKKHGLDIKKEISFNNSISTDNSLVIDESFLGGNSVPKLKRKKVKKSSSERNIDSSRSLQDLTDSQSSVRLSQLSQELNLQSESMLNTNDESSLMLNGWERSFKMTKRKSACCENGASEKKSKLKEDEAISETSFDSSEIAFIASTPHKSRKKTKSDHADSDSSIPCAQVDHQRYIKFEESLKEDEDSNSSNQESACEKEDDIKLIFKRKFSEVNFEIPELHSILDRASKPTPEQRKRIQTDGIKVKYGRFDRQEDRQIRDNWMYFVELNELNVEPEAFFTLSKNRISLAQKKIFLHYLARGMPERTPYNVYKRFKILMQTAKVGRFTIEEDACIKNSLMSNKEEPVSITKLAKKLQRLPRSVEKKVKALKMNQRNIKWHGRNICVFIKYILKVTKTPEDRIHELKTRDVTMKEWKTLSMKLDSVPVRILQRVWYQSLYPALFIPHAVCDLKEIKLQLIKMLHENNETEWCKVDWKQYATHFEGMTASKVYTLFRMLVTIFVPKDKRTNLKKCLKLLKKVEEARIRSHLLHKIIYDKGEIKYENPDVIAIYDVDSDENFEGVNSFG